MRIVVKPNKLVPAYDSLVFCGLCQTTGLPSLVYFTNFYKTRETFLYVFFIIFNLLYINSILLYQFVNLLGRFRKHVFYLNLLLDQINRASFISYIVFHAVNLRLDTCLIDKQLVLDLDSLQIVY